MAKRRLLSGFLFGGILLATGVLPAGAAPTGPTASKLLGPNHRPCGGEHGNEAFGTAAIQSVKTKGAAPADGQTLRVIVAADKVRARTAYDIRLAGTVTGSNTGCYVGWLAGLTTSSSGGMIRFSGLVTVPANGGSFQVWVGPTDTPADIGYVSGSISVGSA
jgi:hypothetical protein